MRSPRPGAGPLPGRAGHAGSGSVRDILTKSCIPIIMIMHIGKRFRNVKIHTGRENLMATDKKIDHTVFHISLLLTGGIALWAVLFNESFTVVSNAIYTFLTQKFGWLYLMAMLFFVFFILLIALAVFSSKASSICAIALQRPLKSMLLAMMYSCENFVACKQEICMYSAEHRFTNLLMTDWESHKMWGCSTLITRGRPPHRVPVLESQACRASKGRTASSRELNYPPGIYRCQRD